MILYHGSNVEVRRPRLLKNQRDLDFGKGFYTTSSFEQAQSWAMRTTRVRGSGSPRVSCYSFDERLSEDLKVLRFAKADGPWLDYVSVNRKGLLVADDYDLVVGPVANDDTFPTIVLYLDGYLDAESTIKRLLPQRLKDQYTFKSEAAVALLNYVEVKAV